MAIVKASELKELGDLYPRAAPSDDHIRRLVDALAVGARLPPVLVDEATMRVVDGFHRWSAYRLHGGPDVSVPVELRHFSSEEELFRAAVEANERHGLPLTDADKGRIVRLAMALKLTAAELRGPLQVTVTRMKILRAENLKRATPPVPANEAMPKNRHPGKRIKPLRRRSVAGPSLAAARSLVGAVDAALSNRSREDFEPATVRALARLRLSLRGILE